MTGRPVVKGQGVLVMLLAPHAGPWSFQGQASLLPSLAVHGACPIISKAKPVTLFSHLETEAQGRVWSGFASEQVNSQRKMYLGFFLLQLPPSCWEAGADVVAGVTVGPLMLGVAGMNSGFQAGASGSTFCGRLRMWGCRCGAKIVPCISR